MLINKYLEEAEVKDCVYDEVEDLCTELIMEVKGLEIEAFNVSNDESFKIGGKYIVTFNLLTSNIYNIPESLKTINVVSEIGYTCHCNVTGIIVFIDEENGYGVIDCGIYIKVELPVTQMFTIGKYVKADGRLDIKKAYCALPK